MVGLVDARDDFGATAYAPQPHRLRADRREVLEPDRPAGRARRARTGCARRSAASSRPCRSPRRAHRPPAVSSGAEVRQREAEGGRRRHRRAVRGGRHVRRDRRGRGRAGRRLDLPDRLRPADAPTRPAAHGRRRPRPADPGAGRRGRAHRPGRGRGRRARGARRRSSGAGAGQGLRRADRLARPAAAGRPRRGRAGRGHHRAGRARPGRVRRAGGAAGGAAGQRAPPARAGTSARCAGRPACCWCRRGRARGVRDRPTCPAGTRRTTTRCRCCSASWPPGRWPSSR